MGVVDYGLNIQQAVNAPRFHHQWLPDEIKMEKIGFSPDTIHAFSSTWDTRSDRQRAILGRRRVHRDRRTDRRAAGRQRRPQ